MSDLVYTLDSNAIIDVLWKRQPVVDRIGSALANNAHILLCPVVVYEVY